MRDYDTERSSHPAAARLTIDTCKSQNRDLTPTEQTVTQSHLDAVTELDEMIKGRALVKSITSLGTSETENGEGDPTRYLSLRRERTKSHLAARMGDQLGGRKSLLDTSEPCTSIEMDSVPYVPGSTANSLLDVLTAVVRGPVFRWMQQTVRTNNAAPVAVGGLKPTSIYSLAPGH